MPKPAPVYDLDFVLHPEADSAYVHFADAEHHPFDARARSITRRNAWWLAEAALLSYWSKEDAVPIFQSAGLTAKFVSAKDTDCYVAVNADAVIVAFRGTESDSWGDILTDARAAQVSWVDGRPERGRVHAGFRAALEDIWETLAAELDRVVGSRTVWFCGHSLGAALATLAADRYGRARGVCTFGSPRVGDPAFASSFTASFVNRCARYVNNHDVVTHVPPPLLVPWPYKHIDPRRFIDDAGQVSGAGPALPHFFGDLIGTPESLLDIVSALQTGGIIRAPKFVLEHMPKAYAIWTWNDYEAHG